MPLILYTTPGAYSAVSVSPFCSKLECWLRMAEIPFEPQPANPALAPKGKVPYVDIDGTKMGDSQLILERLTVRHDVRLDARLTETQRATGHLLRRTLEEGTYWALAHTRWVTEEGWAIQQPVFAGLMPPVIRWFGPGFIRRKIRNMLHAQGTGRHTPAEISAMAIGDLEAASTLLGDGPYLFGDSPTSYDATLFAWVDGILAFPVNNPMKVRANALTNLPAYRARVRERYFPHLAG